MPGRPHWISLRISLPRCEPSPAGIEEKGRGVLYRGVRAFLHIQEGPDGLFADVRFTTTFERRRVSSPKQQVAFLRQVKAELSQPTTSGKSRP